MNKEEFRKQVKKLATDSDFMHYLNKEVDNIIDSGYVNYEKEEKGTYGLAKAVLYAALKNNAEQYKALSDGYKKIAKKLVYA